MKILYIHQYFKTPTEGGAIRSWYIAKGMVAAGHEVVMITSHNHSNAIIKVVDGITVHYLPVQYDNAFGFLRRVISFLSFTFRTYNTSKRLVGIDLCYATSTPITVGIVAYLLKRKRSISYIFEVRDLWPEAPIQMGAIKHVWLQRLLYKLEKTIYTHAEKIIVLSPGIKEGVLKVCPEKNVKVIPNMSDCSFFQFEEKNTNLIDIFSVKDKFVVSYIGSAGPSNNLKSLLNIINFCSNRNDITFLIQAKGSQLEIIKSEAKKLNGKNIQFVPYSNKQGVKEILNISDAIYISFDNKPILQTNSPNKFFDAIASGKLIIVNVHGWLKELIEKEDMGFYADPENPKVFLEKIQPYLNNKTRLLASQSKARRVAESFYSTEILVNELLNEINF